MFTHDREFYYRVYYPSSYKALRDTWSCIRLMTINTACEMHDVNKWGNPVGIILGVFFFFFFCILVRLIEIIPNYKHVMWCQVSKDTFDVR